MSEATQQAAQETAATEVTTTTAPVEQQSTEQAPAGPAKPAEAPTAEQEAEKAATPQKETPGDDPDADEAPRKSKGGFQNRIDKLTREKYEAELRAQQYQRELEQVRKQASPDLGADPGPQPKLEEFTTVDDYNKAITAWAKHEGYREAQKEQEQKARQEAAFAAQAALNGRIDEARRKYSDFDSVVSPIAPLIDANPTLHDYVMQSEMAPEVGYHLGKNPALLFDLQKMHPVNAIRELARLEARLQAPPPPKTLTSAPAPIRPVGASEKAPFSLEKADMDEFVRKRNEDERKARKG